MEAFLYYLLRASVLLALFYGFYKLFLSRNTFYRLNRVMLLIIMFLICVLPLFDYGFLPVSEEQTLKRNGFDTEQIPIDFQKNKAAQPLAAIPWVPAFMVVFVAGCAWTVMRFLIGFYALMRIIRRSEKHPLAGKTQLCITEQAVSPFSWMNYVVISRNDRHPDHQAVIYHEEAHVRLRHSADVLLADLFTCLFWFNPFSWLLRREVQAVHEFQADEQVLTQGIDAKQYQLLLIRKSVGEQTFALANNFQRRGLHKRIYMMMKNKSNNKKKWLYAIGVPVLALSAVILSVPSLQAQPVVEKNKNLPDDSVKVIGYGDMPTSIHLLARDKKSPLDNPLYIVDGEKVKDISSINPEDIESISVLKNQYAVEQYGEEGKNGVVLITSKKQAGTDNTTKEKVTSKEEAGQPEGKLKTTIQYSPDKFVVTGQSADNPSLENIPVEKRPLVILDGKTISAEEMDALDANAIESVSVWKVPQATKEFGDKGKNGVIIITSKKK
ncbi:MAG TPA: hypothetical protein DEF88_10715 [Porphyromonadaceae bacterium]|nr:hypothetical protein [Porphyromonadaceae bacterium]